MFDKFDKNAISNENLYYANLKREKRLRDQTEEMEREKIAMENLKHQMDEEKQYQLDKKNRIKQAQYEDYNNYLKQKYSTPPQYREQLNIKLGGEQRNIRKTNYNEEMENLCINPTTQKHELPNVINYSDMGRKYQKGYSHGYNIITGEVYSDNYYNPNNNNINEENNKKEINNNNNEKIEYKDENNMTNNINYKGISISREEYEEFLRYKEMKRQKALEEQQYLEKEKNPNNYNYNKTNQNNPNENYYKKYENEQPLNYNQPPKDYYSNYERINEKNSIKNNFHYEEQNPTSQKRFDEIKEKENFLKQENKYYEDYKNRLLMERQNQMQENNNYPPNMEQQNYTQNPPYYYEEQQEMRNKPEIYQENQYENRNMNNDAYSREAYDKMKMMERQQINKDKYNNEDYDEQIQFNDNISFPEKQQMNKNIQNQERMAENYQMNENQNQNEIKDINREKYLQFLKEQSQSNNQIRNYPPEQNQYQERERERRENERDYIPKQNQFQNEYNQINTNQISSRDYQEYQEQIKPPTPQPLPQLQQPNKYLSYQEQIQRLQKQKEQEKIEPTNNYPSNNPQISEYNMNKIRNLYNKDNIFTPEQPPKIEPKYNDMPLTEKERKELIQKDYAKYLDWQISEKNRGGKTPYNQKRYNPIIDDDDINVNNQREQNNYEEMKYKENLMNKLPIDPYRNKNYDMNNRNDYGYINNYNLPKK